MKDKIKAFFHKNMTAYLAVWFTLLSLLPPYTWKSDGPLIVAAAIAWAFAFFTYLTR